jgi:hypothetical protein
VPHSVPPPCAARAQLLQPLGVRHFVMMPRRIKYRKAHKSQGFNDTICPNTRQLAFGMYGIRAMEHCRIPAKTLEAVRWASVRLLGRVTLHHQQQQQQQQQHGSCTHVDCRVTCSQAEPGIGKDATWKQDWHD